MIYTDIVKILKQMNTYKLVSEKYREMLWVIVSFK